MTMKPAHRPLIWGLILGLVLPLTGCLDSAGITDIGDREPPEEDNVAPAMEIQDPEGDLEIGDPLRVRVVDVSGVRRVALYLLPGDEDQNEPLFVSDTVALNSPQDTEVSIPIGALPADFPFGEQIRFTFWAEDSRGNTGFAGRDIPAAADTTEQGEGGGQEEEVESAPQSLAGATTGNATIFASRTFGFSGERLGDLVWNSHFKMVYFSSVTNNYVGGFDPGQNKVRDFRIGTGSRPSLLATDPDNFGPGPTLIAFNSGGTDLSLIDLTDDGGTERDRVVIPLINLTVGDIGLQLRRDAHEITVQCPTRSCFEPTLFLGSSALDDEFQTTDGMGATRSLKLTDPNTLADFDVITPEFRGVLPEDQEVEVEATFTNPETAEDSLLFARTGRSQCGTLAFGSTVVATADERGAPIFIGEDGEAEQACDAAAGGSRVFRVSLENDVYHIEASSVVNFDRDDQLRNVQSIDVNKDGTIVALRADSAVFITNGDLRRLATLPVEQSTAVAILEGQENGLGSIGQGGLVAVAEEEHLRIFELDNFREVGTFPIASPIKEDQLLLVRTDDIGGLMAVGITEEEAGLLTVPTDIEQLLDNNP